MSWLPTGVQHNKNIRCANNYFVNEDLDNDDHDIWHGGSDDEKVNTGRTGGKMTHFIDTTDGVNYDNKVFRTTLNNLNDANKNKSDISTNDILPETPLSTTLLFEDYENDIETVPMMDGPLPHPAYDLTESLVAEKMSKLTCEEREAVYHDIHGVSDIIDEDSEEGFLDRKLAEMENELQKISPTQKEAYSMAHNMNPRYVEDQDFRLRFLRTERFDAKLAADRFVRHFGTKLDLFGEDKLARDITQDDLGDEALNALYSGYSQLLPRRDSTGRPVWIWITKQQYHAFSVEALLRRMFYANMMISDEETQRRGSVFICYTMNQEYNVQGSRGTNAIRNITNIARSLPNRHTSVHFCYNNYVWTPVLTLGRLSLHLFMRLRFRAHYGSHDECMYNLQTFGIPVNDIPINSNGSIRMKDYKRFLEKRRVQERQWVKENASNPDFHGGNFPSVIIPTCYDVLLGRGTGPISHAGNIRYRAIIEDRQAEYEKSDREGMTAVTDEIIKYIHGYGGKFLKDDDGLWVLANKKEVRKKVAHSFRALRSSSNAPTQQAKSSLSAKGTPSTNLRRLDTAPRAKRMCRD